MATTTRLDRHRFHAVSSGVAELTLARSLRGLALGAFCMTTAGFGWAQSVLVQPSVEARSVTTDNVAFTGSGAAQADSVLVVTPRLDLLTSNPNYRLNAALAADAISYLGRKRADRLLPSAQANLSAQIIDRWLFVDGSLSADTRSSNPFGVLEEGTDSGFNRATVYRERFSPYIDREISPRERVQLRSDQSWVQNQGANGSVENVNAYQHSQLASYVVRPQPFGMAAEYSRETVEYSTVSDASILFETARLSATYEVAPRTILLIVAGRDRGRYGSTDEAETLHGFGLRWAPTERTALDARVENRFFGTAWQFSMAHRTPFVLADLSLAKRVTTYSAQATALSSGGDLAQLLDSMLSTRITNDGERAIAVQQLIAQRNLPTTLTSAQDLFSLTAQLQKAATVSMAFLGVRHSLTLRAFFDHREDLLGQDPPPLTSSDARQYGGSIALSRRLQPDTTADVSFTRTRVVGLGVNANRVTSNQGIRLGISRVLSPRTTISAALRRQTITSTAVDDANQTSIALGLLHRF